MSSEHPLSYAMRNTEARAQFLSFNSPSELLDWSFLAIELVMISGAILALLHAFRHARQTGSPSALYTFTGIFLYGLLMDISSYYSVENFWHGEFSVMLVWNRLPLYIAMLYPALMYHGYMTIRRYDFKPLTEAICTGFYCGIVYMIFDNLGPSLNWWIWDRESIYSQPLLDSVPLTSYHWLFLFTGALAWWLRKFAWDALAEGKQLKARIGIAITPILTIVLGGLLFMPYNLFLFLLESVQLAALVHALSFFLAGFCFVVAYHKPRAGSDNLLLFFPLLWIASHVFIYAAKFEQLWAVDKHGLNSDGLATGNLFIVVLAIIVATVMTLASHRKP